MARHKDGNPVLGGRWTGKVWLDLTAGLYFPDPYSPRLHMSVLSGIRKLVEDSKLTVCPTDLPTSEVTKAKVDDTDIRGHPLEMRWNDRELETVINGHYVQYVRFKLEGSGRPVDIMTFLYDDANVLFDINFGLTGEEATGDGPLIPEDVGESRLLHVIDRISPFWAVLGVAAFAPDLEEFLAHQAGFGYGNVYLGNSLTRQVGLGRLHDALKGLASVIDFPGGGIYLSLTHPRSWPDPRYEAFVSLLRERVRLP